MYIKFRIANIGTLNQKAPIFVKSPGKPYYVSDEAKISYEISDQELILNKREIESSDNFGTSYKILDMKLVGYGRKEIESSDNFGTSYKILDMKLVNITKFTKLDDNAASISYEISDQELLNWGLYVDVPHDDLVKIEYLIQDQELINADFT